MKSNENLLTRLRFLLFMPSFYGAVSWGFWFALYDSRLMNWYRDDAVAFAFFCGVEIAFITSIIAQTAAYKKWTRQHLASQENEYKRRKKYGQQYAIALVTLHTLAFYGIFKYVRDFGAALGGISEFWNIAENKAWVLRWEAMYTSSIGTQLAYFGWLAIGITVYEVVRGKLSPRWLAPAFVQFLGNFLWVDRTRPTTILLLSCFMALVALRAPQFMNAVKWGALVGFGTIALFWTLGIWVGKFGPWTGFTGVAVEQLYRSVLTYGTCGFAYFNHLLVMGGNSTFPPQNTMYPFFKALSNFGLVPDPPSQIKGFFFVPYPTNVGTFLDPFFRDGGLPLCIVGTAIQTFGVDAIGLTLLRAGKPPSYFAWATLCFTSVLAFFSPKLCEAPIWLFVGIGLLFRLLSQVHGTQSSLKFVTRRGQRPQSEQELAYQRRMLRIKP